MCQLQELPFPRAFLWLPLMVLTRQTRQVVRAINQSSFLRCLRVEHFLNQHCSHLASDVTQWNSTILIDCGNCRGHHLLMTILTPFFKFFQTFLTCIVLPSFSKKVEVTNERLYPVWVCYNKQILKRFKTFFFFTKKWKTFFVSSLEHSNLIVLLVLLFLEEHEIYQEECSQESGFHANVLKKEDSKLWRF